ncbi:unnamed protein product [Nezara viridula]|uniref:Uncharacterized protein n=1 Tax=Nezara viridula TaxID=85310 RepID=A0A9P0EAC4_NEZVI|nr:unnamed protein product [Nezara viridula]
MGNCLKGSSADDISLLRGSESANDTSSDNLGLPPPYREAVPVYYPSPNISRPVNQLTEEEQIKIAKRLGLIQHLPTGSYDGCKKNRDDLTFLIESLGSEFSHPLSEDILSHLLDYLAIFVPSTVYITSFIYLHFSKLVFNGLSEIFLSC